MRSVQMSPGGAPPPHENSNRLNRAVRPARETRRVANSETFSPSLDSRVTIYTMNCEIFTPSVPLLPLPLNLLRRRPLSNMPTPPYRPKRDFHSLRPPVLPLPLLNALGTLKDAVDHLDMHPIDEKRRPAELLKRFHGPRPSAALLVGARSRIRRTPSRRKRNVGDEVQKLVSGRWVWRKDAAVPCCGTSQVRGALAPSHETSRSSPGWRESSQAPATHPPVRKGRPGEECESWSARPRPQGRPPRIRQGVKGYQLRISGVAMATAAVTAANRRSRAPEGGRHSPPTAAEHRHPMTLRMSTFSSA